MKEALLQTLLDQSLPGSGGFKPGVWQKALQAIQPLTSAHVDVDKLKNKHDATKKDYKLWSSFQGKSGWTYTEDGQPLEPREEIDAWFDGHKDCAKFREKGLEFKELCQALYGGTFATGECASPPPSIADEGGEGDEIARESIESSVHPGSLPDSPSSSSAPSTLGAPASFILKRKAQAEAMSSRKKSNTQKVNKQLGEQLMQMNDSVGKIARRLEMDEQGEAIDLFNEEFKLLPFRRRDAVIDMFESQFTAKRYLKLEDFEERRLWVRNKLRKTLRAEDWEDLDESLEECVAAFEKRQNPTPSTPLATETSLPTPESQRGAEGSQDIPLTSQDATEGDIIVVGEDVEEMGGQESRVNGRGRV